MKICKLTHPVTNRLDTVGARAHSLFTGIARQVFSRNSLQTVAVAAAFMGMAMQAQALTAFTTLATSSSQAGAYMIDFGSGTVNNKTSVVGQAGKGDVIFSGSAQGNTFSYTDGGLYSNTALISGVAARPVGSTGNYLSVGNSGSSTGPDTLTFSQGLRYFGFLWGSPDAYNHVTFWNGSTQLGQFDGSAVMANPNGNQGFSRYFNVSTTGNEVITSVSFASSGMAFETDNHAFVTSIPEPETYALMLAGLGLLGAVVRRRKARA